MMSETISNNKRIAKNTLFLYIRTFIILTIALYTSRVVLRALGVDDYGIYNVVGGFVSMFSLLSGALSNAISRYLTFELGKGDKDRLRKVFSTSITVQIILALSVIILAEVFGTWFLNVKMNIPEDRMFAANCVFQCSLMTFAINLISIPFNACIIAHERMKAFAYISIMDAMLKLGAVFLLFIIGLDRLIVYAVLLTLSALLIRVIYGVFCNRNFEECHYSFSYDKQLVKEMTSLAGWNMLGSSGAILNSHGINLLMNLFFGVSLNAARGIAEQVNAAVTQFVNSFTTAVNPQITKTYARGEKDYLYKLVMSSSKYSFFLMLLLGAPIIAETPVILELWLKIVPDYTVVFVRLTLVISLISTLSTPLYTLALATGNIKHYQIVVGSLSLSCFFITYICYKLGQPVETAYYVSVIINIVILFARLKIVSELTGLKIGLYFKNVIQNALFVSVAVAIIIITLHLIFSERTILQSILILLLCFLFMLPIIFFLGLDKKERGYFLSIIFKTRNNGI